MSLYSVRNYLLGFRRISGVNILCPKKRISAIQRKIGIPDKLYEDVKVDVLHLNSTWFETTSTHFKSGQLC